MLTYFSSSGCGEITTLMMDMTQNFFTCIVFFCSTHPFSSLTNSNIRSKFTFLNFLSTKLSANHISSHGDVYFLLH